MITQGSSIIIKDNSGLISGQCILVKKHGNKPAVLGDFIKVAIQKAKGQKKSQLDLTANSHKSSLQTLVLIQTKKGITRCDGSRIRFAQNAGVVVYEKNRSRLLAFKRINTSVPFELKKKIITQLNMLKLARSLI